MACGKGWKLNSEAERTRTSVKSRQQETRLRCMVAKLRPEPFRQDSLFSFGFYDVVGQQNPEGQQAPQFPEHKRGSQNREQNSGIERMPHARVRSPANEFVLCLQNDFVAPIPS